MTEGNDPGPIIHAIVLRQASYVPGNWLLSDIHDAFSLNCLPLDDYEKADLTEARFDLRHPRLVVATDSCGASDGVLYARPLCRGSYAFGGNWLWSDDRRFPARHPLPIHDVPQSEGDLENGQAPSD